jgi:hypothetical protein
MNYLPLVHSSCVYVEQKAVFSGTLGQAIRWMRQQPPIERSRFHVMVQHHGTSISFDEIEAIAHRTGSLGDSSFILPMAA